LHPWVPFVAASSAIVVLVALLSWCWRGVPGRDEHLGDSRGGAVGFSHRALAPLGPGTAGTPASVGESQAASR